MKRNTIQQRAVLNTLEQMLGQHPTANRIYEEISREMPSISRATVYRILNQFAEEGKIMRLSMPSSADRYDSRTDRHLHLGCLRCGDLSDLQLPPIEDAMSRIADILVQTSGFVMDRRQASFFGICKECHVNEQIMKIPKPGQPRS